jgi:hypothetical protein
MRSMQCNVEFGYRLSIRSGTKENHGKPWRSWPVAGPSGCKLTTSQQSGVEYASPNIVSLSVRLLFFTNSSTTLVMLTTFGQGPRTKHISSVAFMGRCLPRGPHTTIGLRATLLNKRYELTQYYNHNNYDYCYDNHRGFMSIRNKVNITICF